MEVGEARERVQDGDGGVTLDEELADRFEGACGSDRMGRVEVGEPLELVAVESEAAHAFGDEVLVRLEVDPCDRATCADLGDRERHREQPLACLRLARQRVPSAWVDQAPSVGLCRRARLNSGEVDWMPGVLAHAASLRPP